MVATGSSSSTRKRSRQRFALPPNGTAAKDPPRLDSWVQCSAPCGVARESAARQTVSGLFRHAGRSWRFPRLSSTVAYGFLNLGPARCERSRAIVRPKDDSRNRLIPVAAPDDGRITRVLPHFRLLEITASEAPATASWLKIWLALMTMSLH